ncbi:acyltransferase [Leptospira ryugenii]|uniref:Acyltransferase n=1 Tax=Leptospira ryugenii TaxID=1917863 RepID=A0A2P2DW40_9LEPT|nr:lysophospholipid acyltransferase family protein [Leptospira ryugenii]GBF48780.1 acyltransferase [Leptospira ryugenii]
MNPIKHATVPYNVLIRFVQASGALFFSDVEEHYLHESESLISPYPTAIIGNHVSEIDIPSLAIVYRKLNPKIKMTIPAREDIMRKDFLTKEFRTKGLTKLLLKGIDKSGMIPFLLAYIGCMPIKRPFRDNSRELIKKGELRETVDSEWNTLVTNIDLGRNLFMFPEGTYSQDGFLNQIKRGVFYLKSKVPTIHFNYFNLTYDTLSFKKSKLHITYGLPFQIREEESPDAVAKLVEDKLGKAFVLTLGNILSYTLLKFEEGTVIPLENLRKQIATLRDRILENHPELKMGSELKKFSDLTFLKTALQKIEKAKLIQQVEGKIKILGNLTAVPKSLHQLKKHNVVLYHKNQLRMHLNKLDALFPAM